MTMIDYEVTPQVRKSDLSSSEVPPETVRPGEKLPFKNRQPLNQYNKRGVAWESAVIVASDIEIRVFIKNFIPKLEENAAEVEAKAKAKAQANDEAMAEAKAKDQKRLSKALIEIATTIQFAHGQAGHFVEVIDYSLDPEHPYLVFREYLGKTLFQAIVQELTKKSELPPFTMDDMLTLIHRIGSSIATMHKQQVFHQDIKLTNILLDEAGLKSAVLADFDIASTIHPYFTGTLRYMSPDAVEYYESNGVTEKYDLAKRDIYAFAFTVYELLSFGHGPFGAEHNQVLSQSNSLGSEDIQVTLAKLKKFFKARKYTPLATRKSVRLFSYPQLLAVDEVMARALELEGSDRQYEKVEDFVADLTQALTVS